MNLLCSRNAAMDVAISSETGEIKLLDAIALNAQYFCSVNEENKSRYLYNNNVNVVQFIWKKACNSHHSEPNSRKFVYLILYTIAQEHRRRIDRWYSLTSRKNQLT